LITEYKTDSKHNTYLIYQLNQLIYKQLTEAKKLTERYGSSKDDDSDDFNEFINSFKKNKIEKR
jgi:hypothetical protein